MKTRILLIMLSFASLMAHAQTIEVGGPQTGVWNADTVKVVADVQVVESLTVAPGTVVLFDGFFRIDVASGAVFEALGTEDDSIRFTVADTTGLGVYNVGKGGWNGFHVKQAQKVWLDYCVLEYGKATDTIDMLGGAMRINLCDNVVISHSTLRYNRAREQGGALSAENSHVVMTDCSVNDNAVYGDDNLYYRYGGGLRFLKCDLELSGMEFLRNNGEFCVGGALSIDSCSIILDHSVFADNIGINGGGLYLIRSNDWYCRMSDLLFDHNLSRHFGGGLAISDSSPEVYNITVTRNSSEGVNCNGIFFYQNSSPRLTNCIVYGNYPEMEMLGDADTIQMWLWTFEGYSPEFRNCLIEKGKLSMTYTDSTMVFEDIIDADPLFRNVEGRDFRLSEDSPCIDAGNPVVPAFMKNGLDLGGMRRVSHRRIDIGAFEYSAQQVSETSAACKDALLIGNPLNRQSRVEFELGLTGEVTLHVFNLTGGQVMSKSLGCLQSGRRTVSLSALYEMLKPGLYFIEIRTPERKYVLKAIR